MQVSKRAASCDLRVQCLQALRKAQQKPSGARTLARLQHEACSLAAEADHVAPVRLESMVTTYDFEDDDQKTGLAEIGKKLSSPGKAKDNLIKMLKVKGTSADRRLPSN